MKKGRKIAVGLMVSIFAVFILLIAAILIIPRFIDRGAVGDKVRSEVSKLVGGILHTIDTIPLSLKGTFDDIHVFPLSPSAVGYELKEAMKDTLGIPIKLTHIGGLHQSEGNGEK